MRFVKIKDLKAGMILGTGLCDLNGNVIVNAGVELSQAYINRFDKEGYMGFYILDSLSDQIAVDDRFNAFKYAGNIDAVAERNVSELIRISINIVDDLVRNHPDRISIISVHNYDDELFYHSVNVCIYSTLIGMELGLDREGLYLLAQAAILHDLGMTEIPSTIRLKVDKSTDDIRTLRGHVNSTVLYLKNAGVDDFICDAIQAHHENENGSGYPNRLESEDIPDFAKILHVADVIETMTSRHPGKEAYLPADVFDYLSSGVGILFHEQVVEAALNKFDAYPLGMEVTLSNDMQAIIAGRTEDNYRPIIMLKDTKEWVDLATAADYQNVTIKASSLGIQMEEEPPVDMPMKKEDPVAKAAKAAMQAQMIHGGKKTIVVVDDVYICRRTAEAALENDFEVHCFENAFLANSYIKNNKVDLLIMDIEMPELDGITAVRQLRNAGYTDLPVIFLTSVNDKRTVVQCLNVGAIDYILKPIKQIYVYERVIAALQNL